MDRTLAQNRTKSRISQIMLNGVDLIMIRTIVNSAILLAAGFAAVGAQAANDSVSTFKASLYQGCIKQAQSSGREGAEKPCDCVIHTLESELSADQLAEFAHGMALNKKKLEGVDMDALQQKLASCGQ